MNNSNASQAFGFATGGSHMSNEQKGSLKMKLANLEVSVLHGLTVQDLIRNIAEEVEYHKKEC